MDQPHTVSEPPHSSSIDGSWFGVAYMEYNRLSDEMTLSVKLGSINMAGKSKAEQRMEDNGEQR
ncbi:MAG: hypothetical protein O3B74_09745 [Proteobacteria bacterium]|nr:hypothetical protein [Pseudomonadota bacterium]